jgi:hypothetical protein
VLLLHSRSYAYGVHWMPCIQGTTLSTSEPCI